MTEPTIPPPLPDTKLSENPKPDNSGAKMAVEYGPILVFVLLYNYLRRDDPDGAIFTAATVFAVVAVLGLLYSKFKLGRLSRVLLFTTVLIVVAVGAAYLFDDPRFIYMRPTVVNALFGVVAIGGALIGKNAVKMLMGAAYTMPDAAWKTIAIRFGVFFFAMAALNEVVWRTQTEAFWVGFKLWGFLPLTFGFMLSQMPFILRHASEAKTAPSTGATEDETLQD